MQLWQKQAVSETEIAKRADLYETHFRSEENIFFDLPRFQRMRHRHSPKFIPFLYILNALCLLPDVAYMVEELLPPQNTSDPPIARGRLVTALKQWQLGVSRTGKCPHAPEILPVENALQLNE